jgi:hypothetical protein
MSSYIIGDRVQLRPHHPGNVWAPDTYWVCQRITSEAHWRAPVITYAVAREDDPHAERTVESGIREDMLRPVEEPHDA